MKVKRLVAVVVAGVAVAVPAIGALAMKGHDESPTLIQTVRGRGYLLGDPAHVTAGPVP